MDEVRHAGQQTAGGEGEIVVVQTFEETHGWPARLSDEELPPARLSLLTVLRLMVLPACELLAWPRVLVLDALLGRKPAPDNSASTH